MQGWQFYSGQVDKEMRWKGKGKRWHYDGEIYIGGFEDGNSTQGKMFELQKDGTHTLYKVEYDEEENEIEREEISRGHKLA